MWAPTARRWRRFLDRRRLPSGAATFADLARRARAIRPGPEAAQSGAASLRRGHCGLGAVRDRLGLVLGEGGQDVNSQPVRLREIDGLELDARFHQVRNEG